MHRTRLLGVPLLLLLGCPSAEDTGRPACDPADSGETGLDTGETGLVRDPVRCALSVAFSGGLEVSLAFDEISDDPVRCGGGGDSDEASVLLGGPDDPAKLLIAFRDQGQGAGEGFEAFVSVTQASDGYAWWTPGWGCRVDIDTLEPLERPGAPAWQIHGSGTCSEPAEGFLSPRRDDVVVGPFAFSSVVTREF